MCNTRPAQLISIRIFMGDIGCALSILQYQHRCWQRIIIVEEKELYILICVLFVSKYPHYLPFHSADKVCLLLKLSIVPCPFVRAGALKTSHVNK